MADEPKKTLADHARGIAALPGEKLAELKAFGAEKVQETMAAFLFALPALKQVPLPVGQEFVDGFFRLALGLTGQMKGLAERVEQGGFHSEKQVLFRAKVIRRSAQKNTGL